MICHVALCYISLYVYSMVYVHVRRAAQCVCLYDTLCAYVCYVLCICNVLCVCVDFMRGRAYDMRVCNVWMYGML